MTGWWKGLEDCPLRLLLFAVSSRVSRPTFRFVLGDAAVGKSSSVERFVKNEFFAFQQPTIVSLWHESHLPPPVVVLTTPQRRAQGAAFLTQTVALDDYIVKFEIWDTAGQERYRSLAPMYYRGAAAALVVYDITDHVRT